MQDVNRDTLKLVLFRSASRSSESRNLLRKVRIEARLFSYYCQIATYIKEKKNVPLRQNNKNACNDTLFI